MQAEARTRHAGLVEITVVLAGRSVVAQRLQHVVRSLEIAIEGWVAWRAGVRAQRWYVAGLAPTESCMTGFTGASTYGFSLSMKWRRGLSCGSGELDGAPPCYRMSPTITSAVWDTGSAFQVRLIVSRRNGPKKRAAQIAQLF